MSEEHAHEWYSTERFACVEGKPVIDYDGNLAPQFGMVETCACGAERNRGGYVGVWGPPDPELVAEQARKAKN